VPQPGGVLGAVAVGVAESVDGGLEVLEGQIPVAVEVAHATQVDAAVAVCVEVLVSQRLHGRVHSWRLAGARLSAAGGGRDREQRGETRRSRADSTHVNTTP